VVLNIKSFFHLVAKSILLGAFAYAPAAFSDIIIGGTGNALGTMQALVKGYQQENPTANITVLPSIGSSGAIKAVPKGRVDIGLSARPLKKSESQLGIVAIEYARTPTVIAVSNYSNVHDISLTSLADIYAGKQQYWEDGTLIRPIIRQANDDNTKQLKQLSPDLKDAINIAESRAGLLFASTDQEAVDKIESTPGSFGVTSLALILSEKRDIHALSLNGIKPTPEACIAGTYPIIKHFYFILQQDVSTEVALFLNFVKSESGKVILETNGNYTP